ncbi:MAG TPA: hypothetical protein VJA46_09020, partial [Acidimicrobiia bacterium]|nr:hypothetical protein [Acidimicrobiia bacterium]
MIEQEATQEITNPSEALEPADTAEPVEPDRGSTPPVLPAKSARRHIWPNLVSALLLVVASSGITYLVVTDSEPDTGVVAGSESDSGDDVSAGSD